MNYIMHSVERIVAQLGNPQNCLIKANGCKLDKLCMKGNFDLKQKLLSISTSSVTPEIIHNRIQVHQTRISILLNILEKKKCYCQSNCEMFNICKQDIIGPLIFDLCDFLKFIYDNFPQAFILNLNAPERVYRHYADIISKSSVIDGNKNTLNEYFKIITEPFINFLKHKKKKYTYQDIKYLMILLESTEEFSCEDFDFYKMVDFCVIHNMNSPAVFQFISEQFRHENLILETTHLKVKHYKMLKEWIAAIDCQFSIGMRSSKDSLKHLLSMWLKKEYNFLNYNIHVTERENQAVNEPIFDYLPKIKINLSVSQFACFIKHLVDKGIIISDNKAETIKQFSYMFASKNSKTISHKSLFNKFFDSDEASLRYIKNVFLELFKSIEL